MILSNSHSANILCYKQRFTLLFADFRRCEMFALLHNHCRYRYTYGKLSHDEGDMSTRFEPIVTVHDATRSS